jgi:hypothetical protein
MKYIKTFGQHSDYVDYKESQDFVKNSAATWNVTGVNGVPSGWTV